MRVVRTFVVSLGLALGALPGRAQTGGATDVPDRFHLEGAYFRVGSEATLTLGGSGLGGADVDFNREFALPSTTNQGYLELYWRAGRRHLLSVGYTNLLREGGDKQIARDISWGGVVFPAGATVSGRTDSDYVSAVYRFALVRNDKLEIGPALGVGHLWIDATVSGPARIGGVTTPSVERTGEVSEITGSLGGYLYAWPARRIQLRGDARYIKVSLDDGDASVTEARAGLVWYAWRQVGIGAQYQYAKFAQERPAGSLKLGGTYSWDGVQALVSFAF